jgi:hypothetical protein
MSIILPLLYCYYQVVTPEAGMRYTRDSTSRPDRGEQMDESLIRDLYRKRELPREATDAAVDTLGAFEAILESLGVGWNDAGGTEFEAFRLAREAESPCTTDDILAVGRYAYLTDNHDLYIHILKIVSNRELYANLSQRIAAIAGEEVRDDVMKEITLPPVGAPPSAYPPVTRDIVAALSRAVDEETCRNILTGNIHGIPPSAHADAAARFAAESDIDRFLADHHARAVATLRDHASSGRPWFEQIITDRVVEYVAANQEILSGVRDGKRVWVTKIPFDPDGFLSESDPAKRRYLACHCPLAREALSPQAFSPQAFSPSGRTGAAATADVPAIWCRCSAGFEKQLFDAIFGESVEVEVTESLLAGDDRCRFAITIPPRICRERGIDS